MQRLTYADTQRLRSEWGRTLLLFLTDRCPVGCAHCSVDSRPDSPTVTDFELFEEIVAGLAAAPPPLVAITGGEPFVERRALPMAIRRLRDADKYVIVFTSGYWASGTHLQPWIAEVLREVGTVFLSTDSFHQGRVNMDRFRRAAGHLADAGCRIVTQALDEPDTIAFVRGVFTEMYGADWEEHADLVPLRPLRWGRGSEVFQITQRHELAAFPRCTVANAPTIRYDGVITGCCNESLIMGGGHAALRRRVRTRAELLSALESLGSAALLRTIATVPMSELARLPGLGELADRRYETICEACWRAHDLVARDPRAAAMVAALRSTP